MPIELGRSYLIAYHSLQARQMELEVLSDNLANINTPGFKQRRASFQALLQSSEEETLPAGVEMSAGAPDFRQGTVQQTGGQWDLAIDGAGFFAVQLPNGQTGYTRVGNFHPDAQGRLVTSQGALLSPGLTIPANVSDVLVDGRGTVTVTEAGVPRVLGQLLLTRFANPEALIDAGDGIFMPSPESGAPVAAAPRQNGLGQILAGALEMSNVDAGQQMVDMLRVQRSYSLTLKALQVSDQMAQITNQVTG